MTTFPSWRTGPNGERRVFQKAEDVPEGWVDGLHPSVRQMPTPAQLLTAQFDMAADKFRFLDPEKAEASVARRKARRK